MPSYTVDRYDTPDGERELILTSLTKDPGWVLVDFAADDRGPVDDSRIVARGLRNCTEAAAIADVYVLASSRLERPAWTLARDYVDPAPYRRGWPAQK